MNLPLPPPFHFEAPGGAVEGPSFSPFFQLVATAIVGGSGWWLWRVWSQLGGGLGGNGGWFLAAWAMMALSWWHVLVGRTRIAAGGITQRWVWNKHLPLAELAAIKLLRVPRLEWLIAPRIYAQTLGGKFKVFYIASPELIVEADRLRRALLARRAV
jgi:hypothetical protein